MCCPYTDCGNDGHDCLDIMVKVLTILAIAENDEISPQMRLNIHSKWYSST
jgi:hypothetical protein